MKIKGGKWSKPNDSINNISGNDLLKPWETHFKDIKKKPEVYLKIGNKINIKKSINRIKNEEIKSNVKGEQEYNTK